MSAWNTALTMAAAGWTAALLQPGNTLISDTIGIWAAVADTIIETTGNAVDWALSTSSWTAAATGLAAVYWWVKVWEFIDEKIFKFENKYLKNWAKIWWGLVWLWYTPIAAPIWLWIAAWKGGKFALKWLGWLWKKIWNSGYSKKSSD